MKLRAQLLLTLGLLIGLYVNSSAQVTADAGPDTIYVCETDSVMLGGSPAGTGPGTLTYRWSPAIGISDTTKANPMCSPPITLTYYLTVDNGSNSAIDSITLIIVPLIVADAGPINARICQGDSVQIGGSPTLQGGSGPLTFWWTPQNSTLSNDSVTNPYAKPTVSTKYFIEAFDSVGCYGKDSIVVEVVDYPTADAGLNQTVCSDDSVQIGGSPTASGGTGGPYNYLWTPGKSVTDSTAANPYAMPPSTGWIKLWVDNFGCGVEDSVLITVLNAPTATLSFNDTVICNNDSIALSAVGSGGSGSLVYSWTPTAGLNNSTIPNPNALPALQTTYHVFVTDTNGCDGEDTVQVRLSSAPVVDAGVASVSICEGDSVQIGGSPSGSGGTGTLSYKWTPGGAVNNDTLTNPFALPTTSTMVTLKVTDSKGCNNSDSIYVNVFPTPKINILAFTGYCGPDSVDLGGKPTATSGTGPLSYSWSPNYAINNTSIANPMARPALDTTYYLVVTDSVGCKSNDSTRITSWLKPTASAGISPGYLCLRDSAIIGGSPSGSGGQGVLTFLWTPSTVSDSTASNPYAKPTGTTNYLLTVTDTNGCQDTSHVFVGVNPLPVVQAGRDTALCVGDSVTLGGSPTASGGTGKNYSYTWNPPGGLSATNVANPKASPLGKITYIVKVVDSLSCSNTDTVTVSVSTKPVADAGVSGSPICSNDSVTLGGSPSGSGGFSPLSYSWTPSSPINNPSLANPNASPDSTTTFYLVVTDSIGCSSMDSVLINVNQAPTIDTSNIQIIPATCDSTNGQILGLTGQGTPTLFYEWSDTSSTIINPNKNLTGVGGGQYWFAVRDGNNCKTKVGPFTVPQLTGPSINNGGVVTTNANCGNNNATISGMAFGGGNAPLTYKWWYNDSTYSDSLDLNNLDNGVYVFIVTDSLGCSDVDSVTVGRDAAPQVDAKWDFEITEMNTSVSVQVEYNDLGNLGAPVIIEAPVNGTALVNGTNIDYTPKADYFGDDSLRYKVCDAFCPTFCDSAKVLIQIEEPTPLVIPNAFTPNGDGWNDQFVIQGLDDYPDNSFRVFNRWGSVVFEATPYNNDWDGTTNNSALRIAGKMAVDGTYFYIFKRTQDDPDPLTGSIELKTKK